MRTFLLTIFIFLISLNAFCQTGVIQGQVYDRRENQVLAFANVWLVDTKKGTTTDLNGNFKIDSLPTGKYDLKVSFIGYGDTTIKAIKVLHDSTLNIKIVFPSPCPYDSLMKDKTCPICRKSNKVIPIVYGLPIGKLDKKNFYYAGCVITSCDPTWYCKRCKKKF